MTALPHLQSLTPGNCSINFLLLCLICVLCFIFILLLFFFTYLFICFILFIYLYIYLFLHHLNLIKCLKPKIFKSICNKFISCHCTWFCTLLLHFGTRAYLFSLEEGLYYGFSTRHNCCEFLASYSVIIQRVIQSYLKTPVCGTSLSYPTQLYLSKFPFSLLLDCIMRA